MKKPIQLLIAWLVMSANLALANDTFDVGELTVRRNEMAQGVIAVPDTGDGISTTIPVTVFNGAHDGPVLALVAGIHGSEYSPILAMQKLVARLETATMSGAVIVVHNANLPAFQQRTIYFGPDDRKNLNRSFPGKADGTITERIADALTQEVIKQADLLMDIHSGDGNERLGPAYTAYYAQAGGEAIQAKSRRMTVAFGLNTIVEFAGDLSSDKSRIYTSAQAVALGVPSMDVESGEMGEVQSQFITPIVDGVMSVMRDLSMIPGAATPAEAPLFIATRKRIYSEHDGVWHLAPRITAGQHVTKGQILGTITDYHGNLLQTITAPATGVLLIVFGTPPVNKGENTVVVGLVDQE